LILHNPYLKEGLFTFVVVYHKHWSGFHALRPEHCKRICPNAGFG
jgi:hypothetical protein